MSCPKNRTEKPDRKRTGVPVRGSGPTPLRKGHRRKGESGSVPRLGVDPDQLGMPPAICESRLLTALQMSRNCLENCVMLFTASVSDLLKFA